MNKFDKTKLIISTITGWFGLSWMLYDMLFAGVKHPSIMPFLFCGILFAYSEMRWTIGYHRRYPNESWIWRQVPRFQENEPDLNVYCLNAYMWFGLMFLRVLAPFFGIGR